MEHELQSSTLEIHPFQSRFQKIKYNDQLNCEIKKLPLSSDVLSNSVNLLLIV